MTINDINKEKCTACMACYNTCPVSAINLKKNNEGFIYPNINNEICINCKKCYNVCPIEKDIADNVNKAAYAVYIKNRKIRKKSTSGGAFSAISDYILKNNGIIYGCCFDDKLKVIHKRITDRTSLNELRGSKYVQSEIGLNFQKIKKDLNDKKLVLFTGTPCQVDGLNNYLEKTYTNLYTCDLVCHGVPTPLIYKEYLSYMEGKYKSKIKSIFFRDKKKSWKCFNMKLIFENGQIYTNTPFNDPYHIGFLANLFLRESCHTCKYTKMDRVSDITIADYWGYTNENKNKRDTDKGISLVLVNSSKGKQLFNYLDSSKVAIEKRKYENVQRTQPCLNKPFEKNINRNNFWNDYKEHGFIYVVDKYMSPIEGIPSYKNLYKYGYWGVFIRNLPKRVLNKIKRILFK